MKTDRARKISRAAAQCRHLLAAGGPAFALLCVVATGATAPVPPGPESEILRLEDRWRLAQKANDAEAFRTLLSPDVTFIGTSGSLRDRGDYIASRSGSWIPRAGTYEYSELRVRMFGDVAIVTGKGVTTGEGASAAVRFTDVWAERSGEWRLVAIQRTDIADAKPGH
jgi:uncharacterized protein (TIGR02246 family)